VIRYREQRGDESNRCPFAEVRIVDAGGKARPGEVYEVTRENLTEQPSGPSPAEQVKQREEKRAEAARLMTETEISSGKCSDAHVDYFRRGLAVMNSYLKGGTGSELFALGTHSFVVASPEKAGTFALGTGLGGELHIFAVATDDRDYAYAPTGMQFQVLDAQGYAVRTESQLERLVGSAFNSPVAGHMLQTNTDDTLKMTLKSHGCVLLFAIRHY
jgi:hypothetical protein